MTKRQKATQAEWDAIGLQTKKVERELSTLMHMSSTFVPCRLLDILLGIYHGKLSKFRVEAQHEMYQQGCSGPHVFYGPDSTIE